MAVYQKTKNGTYYFSVYVPGKQKRLRGSCGTKNRLEAEAFEFVLRASVGSGEPSARKRILKLVDVLFPPEDDDDVSIDSMINEMTHLAQAFGRIVSKSTELTRKRELTRFLQWTKHAYKDATTLRRIDRKCAQAYAINLSKKGYSPKTIKNLKV